MSVAYELLEPLVQLDVLPDHEVLVEHREDVHFASVLLDDCHDDVLPPVLEGLVHAFDRPEQRPQVQVALHLHDVVEGFNAAENRLELFFADGDYYR